LRLALSTDECYNYSTLFPTQVKSFFSFRQDYPNAKTLSVKEEAHILRVASHFSLLMSGRKQNPDILSRENFSDFSIS
jgi:hypothetical protein